MYEIDFYQWTQKQAQLLKDRQFDLIDYDNLIEEIEDMGNNKKEALESNLEQLLMHLLKWEYQRQKRTLSWKYTIVEHCKRIHKTFKKNPSLKPYFEEIFEECYQSARELAAAETGMKLKDFPEECPFAKEFVLASKDTFIEIDLD